MTENTAPETKEKDGQTIDQKNQTGKRTSQKKQGKSQTTIKWSIVTEAETKTAAIKAAKKAGKGLFEWVDEKLREVAIAELTTRPEPPARTEDIVTDIVGKFADKMREEQAEAAKAQNQLIEQQGKQLEILAATINNRPNNLREWIFGKPTKEDKPE